jgi:hypothetical protein
MIQCGRFSWNTTWYIGHPLQSPCQGLPQSITQIPNSFQIVTQDSVQDLIYLIQDLPYPGFSRYEFHVCCLCNRLDSHSVVCFHSGDLGSS